MTESDFHHLLQLYLDGRCTPEQQALVERWYDRLEESEGVMLRTQAQEAVEDAIWQRLTAGTPRPVSEGRIVRPAAAWWQAPRLRWAAALLLFAVGIGWLGPVVQRTVAPHNVVTSVNGWTRQANATQQTQTLQLPDGSYVVLHPESSLRYSTAFAGPKREVHLVGEAFFRVSKNPDRPFLVLTNQVVTTVLGTSFRVKAYKGAANASVAVREGKVAVQTRSGANVTATPAKPAAEVLLLPNEQVVYSVAGRRLKKELVDKPAILVPQAFDFEARPVTEVLAALEKAYGVDVVYDHAKLASCTVSITFYDEPLFEKLGLLCKSLGAYYSLSDAQVIIHSNGCQPELTP